MLKDQVKTVRKKAQSWLGILVYDSAQEQVDRSVFTERLQNMIAPVLKLKNVREITTSDLPHVDTAETGADIKRRLLKEQTPEKYKERLILLNEMLENTPSIEKVEASESPNVFLPITLEWAKITGQDLDFVRRVLEKLQRYYEKWQKRTGCHDFSDSEIIHHQEEYGRFLASFSRILLEETPDEDISNAGELFRQAIRKVSEDDFNDTGQEAIMPAATFITRKTEEQLISALKANPEAKNKTTAPEVEALVEWEKEKQGWGGNTNKAVELLKDALHSNFKVSTDQKDTAAILSSLKTIGRRSILTNLKDAMKGQLKPRFVESVKHILKSIISVKSHWEFSDSRFTTDNKTDILQWLFRRG